MGKKNKSNKGKTPSNNERKNKPEVKKKQNSKQDITGTKIEPQSAQAVEAIENADVSNQPSESVSKKEMEIAERGKNIVPITKDLNESTSISNTFAPGKMENTDELDSTMNTVKMDSQSSIDKASKTVESGKSYRSNEYTSDSCRKMKMLNTGKNLQFNEVSKKSKLNQNKKSDYKSDDSKNHPKESRNEGTASSAENVKNECESEESNLDNWENKNFAEEDLESTACKVNNPKRKDDSWDDKDDNWHVGTSKTNNSPKNEFNYKNWEQNKYGMENDADQFNSKKFRNRSNDKSTEHSRSSYRKSSRSRERADKYYDQFKEKYMRKDGSMDFKVVVEEFGDLFVAGKEYSLGHCVAEDMNMGSGIAVTFRQLFKRVPELLDQRQTQGHVAVLEDKGRYIYYLVTKRISSGKPTYYTMWSSLQRMKEHIVANNVKKLALPRIGCGLDNLEWKLVKKMLEYIFQDVDIEIKIYNFQQDADAPVPAKLRKCKVVNHPKPLSDIESFTLVVYFGSEDGYENEELKALCNKFPYIRNIYKLETKLVGKSVVTARHNEGYLFFGCIVKQRHTDPFNFTNFQKCLAGIQNRNRKEQYEFVAFQAFLEDGSDLIVSKIINLMRYALTGVDIYVCWPDKLRSLMPHT